MLHRNVVRGFRSAAYGMRAEACNACLGMQGGDSGVSFARLATSAE